MKFQPKHHWCEKSCGQESKTDNAEKDVNSKWLPRHPAVHGIKIFDNDDQATL